MEINNHEIALTLKCTADITRIPKQGTSGLIKRTLVLQFFFSKKVMRSTQYVDFSLAWVHSISSGMFEFLVVTALRSFEILGSEVTRSHSITVAHNILIFCSPKIEEKVGLFATHLLNFTSSEWLLHNTSFFTMRSCSIIVSEYVVPGVFPLINPHFPRGICFSHRFLQFIKMIFFDARSNEIPHIRSNKLSGCVYCFPLLYVMKSYCKSARFIYYLPLF